MTQPQSTHTFAMPYRPQSRCIRKFVYASLRFKFDTLNSKTRPYKAMRNSFPRQILAAGPEQKNAEEAQAIRLFSVA